MRTLYVLLLTLFALPAWADTVTLSQSDCQRTRICIDVANDGGHKVAIYAAPTYYGVTVIVDGTIYNTPVGNDAVIVGLPLYTDEALPQLLVLNATFTSRTECVRSGRGQHCYRRWTLTSGSLEL
jgi:hypothetical protein